MRILIFVFIMFLSSPAFAQNAVGVVDAVQGSQNVVSLSISVSNTVGGPSFATSFTVNFASSVNQTNADIKQRIRDILLGYGVNIPVNNIVLFGGAQ